MLLRLVLTVLWRHFLLWLLRLRAYYEVGAVWLLALRLRQWLRVRALSCHLLIQH